MEKIGRYGEATRTEGENRRNRRDQKEQPPGGNY